MNAKQLTKETIEYMNEMYPFMVTHVLKLGIPRDTRMTPFAFVLWDKSLKNVTFHVNVENVSKLSDEGRVFVYTHETFHVLLNHGAMLFKHHEKANIASDIVINDYLLAYGLPKFPGVAYGEDIIGWDSYGMTVKEVYDLLPDPEMIEVGLEGDGDSGIADILQKNGVCNHGDPSEKGGESKTNPANQDFSDFIKNEYGKDGKDLPADIQNAKQEDSSLGGKMAGRGSTNMQEWAQEQAVKIKWAELLKKIAPTAFKEKGKGKRSITFNKLNRKVAYAAPKVVVPVYKDSRIDGNEGKKVPEVVLAIDTSGSINAALRSKFFKIAKSIPQDKVKLRTLSFSDGVREFDINGPFNYISGGTDFEPIEKWIKAQKWENGYPDAVIVFTDGAAHFGWSYTHNIPKNIDKWYWLLQGHYLPHDISSVSALAEQLDEFA